MDNMGEIEIKIKVPAELYDGGATICRVTDEGSDEDYKPLRLDQSAIVRGLTLFPVECPDAWAQFVNEREDRNTGEGSKPFGRA